MTNVKNIIVFGSTGATGMRMLKTGIEKGLQMTAFVRSPHKIPEEVTSKLHRVIKGDIFDAIQVEDAIGGHDAVLSALGPKFVLLGESMVMTQGCQNIISGMKKQNVRKLIVVSGALLLPGEGGILMRLFKNQAMFADHVRQIELLKKETSTGLIDWIALMPQYIINDDNVNPEYVVKINKQPGINNVTVGELAEFSITTLMNSEKMNQYRNCMVGISSRPNQTS